MQETRRSRPYLCKGSSVLLFSFVNTRLEGTNHHAKHNIVACTIAFLVLNVRFGDKPKMQYAGAVQFPGFQPLPGSRYFKVKMELFAYKFILRVGHVPPCLRMLKSPYMNAKLDMNLGWLNVLAPSPSCVVRGSPAAKSLPGDMRIQPSQIDQGWLDDMFQMENITVE